MYDFDLFKERNRAIFKEMGIDVESLQFSPVVKGMSKPGLAPEQVTGMTPRHDTAVRVEESLQESVRRSVLAARFRSSRVIEATIRRAWLQRLVPVLLVTATYITLTFMLFT